MYIKKHISVLFRLYTKTGGEIYPAPVFLYLNRHSFHTVLQFK